MHKIGFSPSFNGLVSVYPVVGGVKRHNVESCSTDRVSWVKGIKKQPIIAFQDPVIIIQPFLTNQTVYLQYSNFSEALGFGVMALKYHSLNKHVGLSQLYY